MEDIIFKTGFDEMDFDKVTSLLAETYWVKGIKKEEVLKGALNSALVVGAFTQDHKQVAYARVTSEKTRFAYVMDVVVDEQYRMRGIAKEMMNYMLSHPEMKDVYKWFLETKDAHHVYEKVGFKPLQNPQDWMELKHPRPER